MIKASPRYLNFYVVALVLVVLAGCGGGNSQNTNTQTPTTTTEFLYATGFNNYILGFTVDASTGTITGPTAVIASPSTTSAISASLAVDPSSKYVFAYDTQNAKLVAFSIDRSSGSLTAVSGSPFPLGVSGSAGGLASNPVNDFLYVADFSNIVGFGINSSSGALATLSGSPFSDGNFPFAVTFTPSGAFLYASESSSISGFAVNASTGALTPVAGSPFPTLQYQSFFVTAITPSGKFLYSTINNVVTTWDIDMTTGVLNQPSGIPAFDNDLSHPITSMVIDPAGKFLFACDASDNVIAAFSIDPNTGALTLLNTSHTRLSVIPEEMIIDPSGQFLYAANQLEIQAFQIDTSTGSLAPVSTLPLTGLTELAIPSTLVMVRGQ